MNMSEENLSMPRCDIDRLQKEVDRLKMLLNTAINGFVEIEKKSDKFDSSWSIEEQLDFIKAECQSMIYKIREVLK